MKKSFVRVQFVFCGVFMWSVLGVYGGVIMRENTTLLAPVVYTPIEVTTQSFVARWSRIAGATGYRLDVSTNSHFTSLLPGYANLLLTDTTKEVLGLETSYIYSVEYRYFYRVRAVNTTTNTISGNSDTITVIPPPRFTEMTSSGFSLVGVSNNPSNNIGKATSSFGDFDNDGDLDLFLAGRSSYNTVISKLYRNMGAAGFVEMSGPYFSFVAVEHSTCSWADYNKDGYVDLFISGENGNQKYAYLYRNEGGIAFSVASFFEAVSSATSCFGDYDKDGYPDLFVSGVNSSGSVTISNIYKNNGGNWFSLVLNTNIAGTENGSAVWGDYDKDSDLDLLLSGTVGSSGPYFFRVYENRNGTFTPSYSFASSVYNGSISVGDYDSDSDIDVFITGHFTSLYGISKLYKNNSVSAFSFSEAYPGNFTGLKSSTGAFGDYDNDGDLDLFLSGVNVSNETPVIQIYYNTGNGFVEDQYHFLSGVSSATQSVGDYDNDGDIDIFISGRNASNNLVSKFYRNNSMRNSPPLVPTHLRSVVNGQTVTLTWDATDDRTATSALSYNIYIKSIYNNQILNVTNALANGVRKIAERGSIAKNSYTITLPFIASYYKWSVQAIDASLQGGAWAAERDSFFLKPVAFPAQNITTNYTSYLQPTEFTASWNESLGATGYRVEVALDTGFTQYVHGYSDTLVSGTNLRVRGYPYTTFYYYRVRAVNTTTNFVSLYSNRVSLFASKNLNQIGFAECNTFLGQKRSSNDVGDYDGDGDLDIIVSGNEQYSQLYQNQGNGNFIEVYPNTFIGVYKGYTTFIDYDNDGDEDIFVTGGNVQNALNPVVKLYKNNETGFTESVLLVAPFETLHSPTGAIGDYDSDGYYDIFLSGERADRSAYSQAFYRNMGGTAFTKVVFDSIQAVGNATANMADFDNDGDLDLFLGGRRSLMDSTVVLSQLYRNIGTGFRKMSNTFTGIRNGTSAFIDYDKDGFVDLWVSGNNGTTSPVHLYKNMNGTGFTRSNFSAFTYAHNVHSTSWGDYDGDGDLDVFIGQAVSGSVSKMYKNNITGFSEVVGSANSGFQLPYLRNGSSNFGDFDGDGDADLLVAGENESSLSFTKIYCNKSIENETPFDTLTLALDDSSFTALNGSGSILLQWNNTTPNRLAFNYDIYIDKYSRFDTLRSHIKKTNATSPYFRRINNIPYTSASYTENNLSPGFYYWSVRQSDGQSYLTEWGSERTFMIIPPASKVTKNSFVAIWNRLDSVRSYTMETSPSFNFTTIDSIYTNIRDTVKQISGINNSLYYRIKPINADTSIHYSNIISVRLDTGYFSPSYSFAGMHNGASAFGDYDNDGDMDIFIMGIGSTGIPISMLYKNNGIRGFSEVFPNFFPKIANGAVDFKDKDGDGDLDILLVGNNNGTAANFFYTNNNGTSFTPVSFSNAIYDNVRTALEDYDNDGDIDIFLSSRREPLYEDIIFRNNGTGFVSMNTPFSSADQIQLADLDIDGDLDIFVTQRNVGTKAPVVYWNRNGIFSTLDTALSTYSTKNAALGDYDNDGDLDIFLGNNASSLFKNNNGIFSEKIPTPFPSTSNGSSVFADYNNDGYLDMLLTGNISPSNPITRLYRGIKNGFSSSYYTFVGVQNGIASFVDIDFDGDLDVFVNGQDNTNASYSILYLNNKDNFNRSANPPLRLEHSVVSNNKVVLSWGNATDIETPQNALQYNISLRSSPSGSEIRSSHFSSINSFRNIIERGSIQGNTTFLQTLSPGVYYWNVQAIDAGLKGGAWATQKAFTITHGKNAQTISFDSLRTLIPTNPPLLLTATSSSSLTVSYQSTNTNIALISNDSLKTRGVEGETYIIAFQQGDSSFYAAEPIVRKLIVSRTFQTLDFLNPISKTYGDSTHILPATTSAGLIVSYMSSNSGVATIYNNTVTLIGTGTTLITATQTGNISYTPISLSQVLRYSKLQTITFSLPMQVEACKRTKVIATVSSGLTLSYSSTNTMFMNTIQDTSLTIQPLSPNILPYNHTITAYQPGNIHYYPSIPVTQTTNITKINTSITFDTISRKRYNDIFTLPNNSSTNLSACSNTTFPITYTTAQTNILQISNNTIQAIGVGTATITATVSSNFSSVFGNFHTPSPVSRVVMVEKTTQSISFINLSNTSLGYVGAKTINVSASSGLPVTLSPTSLNIGNITGSPCNSWTSCTINFTGGGGTGGSRIITASQAGNSYYLPTQVDISIPVKENQTVTFVNPSPREYRYGDPPFVLTTPQVQYSPSITTRVFPFPIDSLRGTVNSKYDSILATANTSDSIVISGIERLRAISLYRMDSSIDDRITSATNIFFGVNSGATSVKGSKEVTITGPVIPIFLSSDTEVISMNNGMSGNTATIAGVGFAEINAFVPESDRYFEGSSFYSSSFLPVNVLQGTQTITFNALPDKIYSDTSFIILASTNSNLPIYYVSTNTTIQITGDRVTLVRPGGATITAYQTGNINYTSASPVSRSFSIFKAPQSISFSSLPEVTYGDNYILLTAVSNSRLPISFNTDFTGASSVIISHDTLKIQAAGTVLIIASQLGNDSYYPARDSVQTLIIHKKSQSITFDSIPVQKFIGSNPFFTIPIRSSSSIPISYSFSNPTLIQSISPEKVVTMNGVGSTIITSQQSGNNNYTPSNTISRLLIIKADQSITLAPIPPKFYLDRFKADIFTESLRPITYRFSNTLATVVDDTLIMQGVGTVALTVKLLGDAYYLPSDSITRIITITKRSQTIRIPQLPTIRFGDAPFVLGISATSSLSVSSRASNGIIVLTGNTATIRGSGIVAITSQQTGNINFLPAKSVVTFLTIQKKRQSIAFPPIAEKTYQDAPFSLIASNSANLPITFITSNSKVSVSGNNLIINEAGITTITAFGIGDQNYEASDSISQSLTIHKKQQTIHFPTIQPLVYQQEIPTNASATSQLPLSYQSSHSDVIIFNNTIIANTVGTVTIVLTQEGNKNFLPANFVFQIITINKKPQTITFPTIPKKIYGDPNFILLATASSNKEISFSTSNTLVSIFGKNATIQGAGTVTIYAIQEGDDIYDYEQTSQVLSINKKSQNISFPIIPHKTTLSPLFTPNATASSLLPPSYISLNSSVSMVDNQFVKTQSGGMAHILALQTGNENYLPATPITQSFIVFDYMKKFQTIHFPTIGNKIIADETFILTASSTSALEITYISSDTSLVSIIGNTAHIIEGGAVSITAYQSGNDIYNIALPVTQIVNIFDTYKDPQTITFENFTYKYLEDQQFTLTANSSSKLPITFISSNTTIATITHNNVMLKKGGVIQITAKQDGNTFYNPATPITKTLFIFDKSKENQSIQFDPIAPQVFGYLFPPLNAFATSGLSVYYTSQNTNIATVDGNMIIVQQPGIATITAFQNGDAIYNPATPTSQYVIIHVYNKKYQTITFKPIPEQKLFNKKLTLTAYASSSLPISYTSSDSTIASISENIVSFKQKGIVFITALQHGDEHFNPAIPITEKLFIQDPTKTTQTITFSPINPKYFHENTFSLNAFSSSGLEIIYQTSNLEIVALYKNTITILSPGTINITATQTGNNEYLAATPITQTITINKSYQTAPIPIIIEQCLCNPIITLPQYSSASLPITYSSSTKLLTINKNNFILLKNGIATITAYQTGNNFYNPINPLQILVKITPLILTPTQKNNTSITIYPNPTHDYITIQSNKTQNVSALKLYDMTGKYYELKMKSNEWNGTYEIDLKTLVKGEYILVLYDETGKILKAEKITKN